MKVIDQGAAQIALVVDDDQRLLGTLTDGDIRRGLLHGASLDSPVHQLMNHKFRFVRSSDNQGVILEMMRREVLGQIPVLDEDGLVVELLLLQELLNPQKLDNSVVIMAGGKGTRLRPYTENCPKPMIPVGGRPMLEILLEKCIADGFSDFYFSVNYLKEQIIEHFADGARWGVSIRYLIENEPLGTAGSLQLLPVSLTKPFLVLNGDVLTRLDFSHLLNFHTEHRAQASLCVREQELTVPFGVVQTKGIELAGFEEKPTYRHQVNAGVYVIDPQLLTLLPPNQFTDMPSLLKAAQEVGHRVAVCPIHEYWLDVGRPETLQQAHREWCVQEEP
ncbi:D-glycero-alpha-D-manno-heptose 1-phosphate guanylyltransferase [Synechococcus sp. MIT S9504]|nr:D-glycero-alpha-D-manno-heptose 1-phosphate guanylyltransferase [Synechococcus sp. MIT S9504]